MLQALLDFPKQFTYQPKIINASRLKKASRFVVLGMGGSNLAAGLIKIAEPSLKISSHRNYGLPYLDKTEIKQTLFIASSYSGNTEETIDGYKMAVAKKYNTIVLATGGRLLALAKKNNLPYIQIPNTHIQPRAALGYSLRATLKAIGLNKHLTLSAGLGRALKTKSLQNSGQRLAQNIKNRIPLVYASAANKGLAYNWKIKLNETGKTPAFANVFPELNHNEINGFDQKNLSKKFGSQFYVIMLKDDSDHPRIAKRMKITISLYRKRGLDITCLYLQGQNIWAKIFSNLLLADWTAYYLAKNAGQDSEAVPIIEQLKKLL